MSPSVRAYVHSLAVVALASVGWLYVTVHAIPDAGLLGVLAAVGIVAAVVPIRFVHEGGIQAFTLEGGVVGALLLSGFAGTTPAIMMAVSFAAHAARSRNPTKATFNAARSGVESSLATVVFLVLAPSSSAPGDVASVMAVLVAAVLFEIASFSMTTELMVRLGQTSRRGALTGVARLWAANVTGNVTFGIVLAAVAVVELWIAALTGIFMLVMYLGYRGYAAAVEGERRAHALNEMTHLLLGVAGKDDDVAAVVQELVTVFGARRGQLTVEGPTGTLVWQVSDGAVAVSRGDGVPRRGPAAAALARGRAIIEHVADDDLGPHDVLAAPVVRRGQLVGAVTVAGRRGVEPWNSSDVALFEAVANELAVALDNVVLFQQVEDERARLEAETEKLNDILGAASDGIASILADGTIEAWNPGMARITGVEAEAAVGQPWHAVLRLKDASGTDLAPTGNHVMRRALRGELRDEAISLQTLQTDGAWRWLQCTASPVRHPDGEQRGLVLVARDVTAERELDDLKADFIATVSHELRTPLTPLKGFLATLRNPQAQLTHDQVQTIHTSMGSQLTRLETLIADLLAVAELDHGQFDLRPEPMAIGEVVADAVRVEAADQFLRCSLEMDQDVVAVADPVALVRIVRSLTSNAIKHTDGRITVHVVEADGAVEVRIRDEGPGIAPWDQDRVFNRFERLGDHLRRTQGPGLGLTIARSLAQRMGGDIRVDSELGQGATFVLSLPRAALRPVPLRAVSDA